MARYDLTAEEFAIWLEARLARMRALADDLELVRIVQRIAEEKAEMNRLQEKFAKAGGIVQRQALKIEARLDSLIAREGAIEAKTDQAFHPHESTLDATEKGLDAFEHQLAGLTNGAPLDSSSDSPVSPQAVPAQPPAIPPGDARKFDRMG